MLSFIAALSMTSTVSAPIDRINLTRAYKADEAHSYSVHAEMEGAGLAIDAEVVFKLKKTSEAGADFSMTTRKFLEKRDGSETGSTGPEELVTLVDKFGAPHLLQTNNEGWIYYLAALTGFVPGKEVEVGDGFDVKWAAKDQSYTINGKGKVLELVDHEGAKAARIEYDIEVKPSGEEPGLIKCKSLADASGGGGISVDGTVEVQGQKIKFSVKKLKS